MITTTIPTSELRKILSLIVLKKPDYSVLENLLVQVYPNRTIISSTDLTTTQSFVLPATNTEIGSFLVPFAMTRKLIAKTKTKEVGLTPNAVLLEETFPFEVPDKVEDFPDCLYQFTPLFELNSSQLSQLSQLATFTNPDRFDLCNVEIQGLTGTSRVKAIATDAVAAVITEGGIQIHQDNLKAVLMTASFQQ